MSQGATEGGQDPNNGGAGGQGQDSAANNGHQGQDPNAGQGQQNGGQGGTAFDLSTVTDPALRAHLERQEAELTRARGDAARYRTERNTDREALTALQRQNETAEQTAAREAQERQSQATTDAQRLRDLEAENLALRVGGAVEGAAREARAYNPAMVAQMVRDRITVGDDGQPNNTQDVINALKESDPYLFRKGRNDAGAGQGGEGSAPPQSGGMNDLIRGMADARRGRTTN